MVLRKANTSGKVADGNAWWGRTDYNQTHFVRNETFKKAADKIQGPTRKIFVEFLERSCTAEFSGFLLYKELGRRLKKTNPVGRSMACSMPLSPLMPGPF